MKLKAVWIIGFAFCLAASAGAATAQTSGAAATAPIKWADSLKQKPEWYGSDEAVRIADNLLLYQRDAGGWSKNTDMAEVLTQGEKAAVIREKQKDDSNIDNGATYTQLAYLARVYGAKKIERHKGAFLEGLDYLLEAQYDNGGWPQYYPRLTGYHKRITFNDGAMIGVMRLLRDVAQKKADYLFVGEALRGKAEGAVRKGVELILKTQVVVNGKRTVWAAQYDEVTLAPAAARKFEPVALTSSESVGIVRFLTGIKQPGVEVIEAIESAADWYHRSKITGIRWVEKPDPSKPGGRERVAVNDPNAGPLWARFYEIGTNRPVFVGRDGVTRYNIAEIDEERRNGYDWYVSTPARLLEEDYAEWRKKRLAVSGHDGGTHPTADTLSLTNTEAAAEYH